MRKDWIMNAARHLVRLGFISAAIILGAVGWQAARAVDFLPGSVAVENGDVNADGGRDISDAIYILNYLFIGGPAPLPLGCEPQAEFHNGDVNGSGSVAVSDVIFLLNWMFRGGRDPVEGCPSP
jgi:hypothetical protein